MRGFHLETISRIVIVLIIGFLFFYMVNSMTTYSGGQSERQMTSVEAIIDKALVQCYALEGGYPTTIEYIENYGVILNHDKYIYFYEWYGSNLKPEVKVIEK